MDAALYRQFFEIEDTYWWSRWVRDMVADWMRGPKTSARILDLGCGTGALSRDLQAHGSVVSLDYVADALAFCRERGLSRLVRGDGMALPFANRTFHTVVALDTLEHLADDSQALREIHRVLVPGGRVIINVPALRLLWSQHDVVNHHFRRYRRQELRARLVACRFGIEKLTYTNCGLFPPTLAARLLGRFRTEPAESRADLPQFPPWLDRACYALVTGERRLVRKVPLPIGTSVFAVARRVETRERDR